MFRERRLEMRAATVVKSADPRLLRIEVEKTRRAARIGKETGLFRVPEVLDFDEAKGMAVFERVEGFRTLARVLSWPARVELAERIGRSLAAVHRDLKLPAGMVIPLPEDLAGAGGQVFLHGDFGLTNIGLGPDGGELVILDWQFTDMHGEEATYGTRYFDLVWFVNNLIWRPTARHLWGDPVGPVARRFIEAYHEAGGLPYDRKALRAYASRFFELKRPARRRMSRRRYYYLPICFGLERRFLRSLGKDGSDGRPTP